MLPGPLVTALGATSQPFAEALARGCDDRIMLRCGTVKPDIGWTPQAHIDSRLRPAFRLAKHLRTAHAPYGLKSRHHRQFSPTHRISRDCRSVCPIWLGVSCVLYPSAYLILTWVRAIAQDALAIACCAIP